jgi:CspA family cold shock protein
MLGIVTWFNIPKGYGEIYAETGETLFFTYHALPKSGGFRTIERGKVVEFRPGAQEYFGMRMVDRVVPLKGITNKHKSRVEKLLEVIS